MSDEVVPANSNVVPLGRGQFFAVDRRAWAKACDLGMNAAIAYLVMARGTGHDMRSTSWSAKAMQERTSVPWRQCKAAIQAVVTSGLVRQDKGGQHPRYTVMPAHEVPGCVPGAKRPALSDAETRLVDKIGDHRVWVPKTAAWNSEWRPNTKPHDLALSLVKKGVLVDDGDQFFSVIPPVEDDKPDWIWLPNAVTDGAAGEEIPVELIRQSANQAALRLFVDLYHAQSLNDFGGVHWRQVRRTYDRHRVGERGSYVVWGFKEKHSLQAWPNAPFTQPYLKKQFEHRPRAEGGFERIDIGWKVLWDAFAVLETMGLIEMVGHLVNTDSEEGTVLHPFAMRNGEPGERAIAMAAHEAGHAMLNETKQADAIARRLWLVPVRSHMTDVQLVGLARLRYRARTRATASWVSDSAEWGLWVERYRATAGSALGSDVDINGTSTEHQRDVNGIPMSRTGTAALPRGAARARARDRFRQGSAGRRTGDQMRTKESIITPPDPLSGRRRSRVDAYMPWSSLSGMMPVRVVPAARDAAANTSGPSVLPGGCQLYSFPSGRR